MSSILNSTISTPSPANANTLYSTVATDTYLSDLSQKVKSRVDSGIFNSNISKANNAYNSLLTYTAIDGILATISQDKNIGSTLPSKISASFDALAASGTLDVNGVTTLTGALNANGGITCDTDKFIVADTTGNTSISGTLGVTGATTLTGALNANGGITCDTDKFIVADTTGNTSIGGTLEVTGVITMNGTGSSANHVATRGYVDSVAEGLHVKDSVRVATTANGTLSTSFASGSTIDGITLATGDRILIKNQADGSVNGIYTVNATGSPTRATDFNASADVTGGAFTFVREGTVNADTGWVLTTDGTITIGTTSLTFSQFSGAGSLTITEGTGVTVTQSGNEYTIAIGQAVGTNNDVQFNSVTISSLYLGGQSITATAAELNILDGDTTATSTTVVGEDKVVFNDSGTMKQVAMSDIKTYTNSDVLTYSTVDRSSATQSTTDPTTLNIALEDIYAKLKAINTYLVALSDNITVTDSSSNTVTYPTLDFDNTA